MNVALDMFKDFNLTVSRKYKLEGFQDLHSEITNFKAIRDAEKKQEELDKKQEELDFKEFQDANKKQEEMLQQARHKAIEKQIKKHEEGNTSFKETEAARKEKLNKVDANRTEYVVKLAAEADANRVNGVENVEAVKAV
ncbi:hypothetical protein V9T40_001440 [Parthenolecanium corni]|uniref:Uncharacterized protein n=1 Tax=Parthenolecanium corni TaxID=536013 RepID=A0AAN9TIL3_9HEMI